MKVAFLLLSLVFLAQIPQAFAGVLLNECTDQKNENNGLLIERSGTEDYFTVIHDGQRYYSFSSCSESANEGEMNLSRSGYKTLKLVQECNFASYFDKNGKLRDIIHTDYNVKLSISIENGKGSVRASSTSSDISRTESFDISMDLNCRTR